MPDRKTRGRTSPLRLAALDRFLVHSERALLQSPGAAPFVDLGFGEHPWTTLEAARALRECNPDLPVIGLERDASRVEHAQPHVDPHTRFLLGGFESLAASHPTGQPERSRRPESLANPIGPARIIRVMNVLRGYREDEAQQAHAFLEAGLVPGGLALEGSASPDGEVLTCFLLRKTSHGLAREGLLFHTDFRHGFSPWMFRDYLPRAWRRSVRPGSALFELFTRWAAAIPPGEHEAPARWMGACARMLSAGEELDPDPWLSAHGFLIWRPRGGVPVPAM